MSFNYRNDNRSYNSPPDRNYSATYADSNGTNGALLRNGPPFVYEQPMTTYDTGTYPLSRHTVTITKRSIPGQSTNRHSQEVERNAEYYTLPTSYRSENNIQRTGNYNDELDFRRPEQEYCADPPSPSSYRSVVLTQVNSDSDREMDLPPMATYAFRRENSSPQSDFSFQSRPINRNVNSDIQTTGQHPNDTFGYSVDSIENYRPHHGSFSTVKVQHANSVPLYNNDSSSMPIPGSLGRLPAAAQSRIVYSNQAGDHGIVRSRPIMQSTSLSNEKIAMQYGGTRAENTDHNFQWSSSTEPRQSSLIERFRGTSAERSSVPAQTLGIQKSRSSDLLISLPSLSDAVNQTGSNDSPSGIEAEVDALTSLLMQNMNGTVESKDIIGMCAKCNRAIKNQDTGCNALDQLFHVRCFQCTACECFLKDHSFYAMEGKPYCEACYLLTLEKCSVCNQPITDRLLRATGRSYHSQCFTCVICSCSLDGIAFTVDASSQIHCIDDFHRKYAPRCCVCSQPILPCAGHEEATRIVALEKSFHIDCYRCQDCGTLLSSAADGHGCYPLDNRLLCRMCNNNRIRSMTGAKLANSIIL